MFEKRKDGGGGLHLITVRLAAVALNLVVQLEPRGHCFLISGLNKKKSFFLFFFSRKIWNEI